jgi:hypothetical protein
MPKVVINRCYGGFGVSLEAAREMAGRGHARAAEAVSDYDARLADRSSQTSVERQYGVSWYGGSVADRDGERADPILVAVVEEMGAAADGEYASLSVVAIPDDVEWEIDDYDGIEQVHEKHRVWA